MSGIPKDINEWPVRAQLDWYKEHYHSATNALAELHENVAYRNSTSIDSYRCNDDIKSILNDIINLMIDPNGYYYEVDKDSIIKRIEDNMGTKVAVLYNDDVVGKGRNFDDILEKFALGYGGYLTDWNREESSNSTLVIRGLGGNSRKAIKQCWETGRPFYAIDTGYLGNDRFKTKVWHRVTYNNLQHLGPIVERPLDRLDVLKYKFKKFREGSKILICPPSEKVMRLWDQPSPEEWTAQIVEELKQ